jgi:hypothetical protein
MLAQYIKCICESGTQKYWICVKMKPFTSYMFFKYYKMTEKVDPLCAYGEELIIE